MRLILPAVLIFVLIAFESVPAEVPVTSELLIQYPIELYQQEDYYRTISEILKLEFTYPEHESVRDLRPYLLKSHYFLGEYRRVIQLTGETFANRNRYSQSVIDEIANLATVTFLKQGSPQKAKAMWEYAVKRGPDPDFPTRSQVPDLIDPDRARLYSSVLPGSGLLLSDEYGKATASFLINAIFIAGCYHYIREKQWGIAGLLFFFEIGWYSGGINSAEEAAVNYNNRLIRRYQDAWIEQNIGPIR